MQHRLGTVDALRAVAAVAVAWFHFTNGSGLLNGGWLHLSGRYGWLGVELFFVISGFIIPYSLYRSNYRTSDYGSFLLKRCIRLDPPYFVDILLCIALSYLVTLVPGFRGQRPHYSFGQLVAHIAYINSFVHLPWINVVFWSLGIEFQYYVLIGVCFPLLVVRENLRRFSFLAVLLALSVVIPDGALVFRYLPLFVMGILAFQSKASVITTRTFLVALSVTLLVSGFVNGVLVASVGGASAMVIRFVQIRASRLTNVGLISYSLYLLHVPVGGKIMNLGGRFAHSTPEIFVVAIGAMAGSMLLATVFYRYIELPSQRFSSAIRYRSRREALTVPVT